MRHSMIRTTFFSFYSFFSFPHSFLIHSWLWVRRYSCNSLKLILLLLNKNELACVSLFHYGLIFTVNSIAWRQMCCLLRIDCHFDVVRKKLCLCVGDKVPWSDKWWWQWKMLSWSLFGAYRSSFTLIICQHEIICDRSWRIGNRFDQRTPNASKRATDSTCA